MTDARVVPAAFEGECGEVWYVAGHWPVDLARLALAKSLVESAMDGGEEWAIAANASITHSWWRPRDGDEARYERCSSDAAGAEPFTELTLP